jgi:nicotinate-nucleotide--dimethylbenzimidazole phosphoribosyltransferase
LNLLEKTIANITAQGKEARALAHARLETLTMPYWALGRLMDLAEDLAGMTGSMKPAVARKTVVIMAADHGITAQGVSKYPQEVTIQMVYNFVRGGAGINALARQADARVVVVDLGVAGDLSALVEKGQIKDKKIAFATKDITLGPAMSREEARRAVEAGIEVALELGSSTDVFGTGEMGIGNTAPSSAIVALYSGAAVGEVTGRGTGIEDHQLSHKIAMIEKAIRINVPDMKDPLDVLSKVGGFEIGGIAGLILGAASLKRPVLVDGFISTAGALIAAHRSQEPGHRIALQCLGKQPLLDLDLRLGEGTGAALAMPLLDTAVRILTEIATFDEAGVSKADA